MEPHAFQGDTVDTKNPGRLLNLRENCTKVMQELQY